MTLERRNPLPVGFYQVDLPKAKLPLFVEWRDANRDSVKVRKTEEGADFAWLLFEVLNLRPVIWDRPAQIGFPSIAKKETVRVPGFEPSKDVLDQVADSLPKPVNLVWLLWGAAIIGGLYMLHEIMPRRD